MDQRIRPSTSFQNKMTWSYKDIELYPGALCINDAYRAVNVSKKTAWISLEIVGRTKRKWYFLFIWFRHLYDYQIQHIFSDLINWRALLWAWKCVLKGSKYRLLSVTYLAYWKQGVKEINLKAVHLLSLELLSKWVRLKPFRHDQLSSYEKLSWATQQTLDHIPAPRRVSLCKG